MDLSPGQQKAVFAVIVIVLAALGYYLVVPAVTHARGHAQASATATPAPTQQAAQPTQPPVTTSPAAATGVNIYAWLPFTQQDLAQAAAVAVRFAVDYDTFSYTETGSSYVGRMGDLITTELATTIAEGYDTVGVAALRTSQKQSSRGTAVIDSLRAFGPSSLTFVITAGQRLVSGGKVTTGSTQYAVTVTDSGSAGRWQVSDIEPATEGNS